MENENYLYFGEDSLGASATAGCWPASSFISASPSAATKIKLMFKALSGAAADDQVELTFTTASAHQNAMRAIARALNNPSNVRNNMVTVYDGVAGVSTEVDSFNGTAQAFTAVDITLG
tara:strand:- start:412 stop:768 length:357 start_codon:yes stop_codon:yes gene_type:complete